MYTDGRPRRPGLSDEEREALVESLALLGDPALGLLLAGVAVPSTGGSPVPPGETPAPPTGRGAGADPLAQALLLGAIEQSQDLGRGVIDLAGQREQRSAASREARGLAEFEHGLRMGELSRRQQFEAEQAEKDRAARAELEAAERAARAKEREPDPLLREFEREEAVQGLAQLRGPRYEAQAAQLLEQPLDDASRERILSEMIALMEQTRGGIPGDLGEQAARGLGEQLNQRLYEERPWFGQREPWADAIIRLKEAQFGPGQAGVSREDILGRRPRRRRDDSLFGQMRGGYGG